MSTATQKTAQYKGRAYRLLYIGPTKFGQRAHLQFLDGSKDFWVDAVMVSTGTGTGTVTERQANAGHGRGREVRSDCCGYPCPVSGRRCTPSDPCHDCQ